ncbi:LysR substrate-binding domain-containing protein [Paractinoplanes lichenicola]|uniref:LysR family transcriptional regulator n=1 Tax=Paractinoplanes lichenicola TaxID=2802976 RepID=A0ABS1VG24_9ACTN|nr:LysR substrate-binding domain-containing protein [Actinoplanes lichenicola]MBL7253109.1 LysR family transcriptional regulator [Actinoplanes lichenicola]
MPIEISPRAFRYFLAVAEELHFGRAAARLYISQPSLSHQIRKLEEDLGTPLFVRSSRRVQLTAAGRTLAQEVPPALAALEHAVELTRLAGSGRTTTIRLGYTPVASFGTLTSLLEAIEADHPELTVDARELFSAEIPVRLQAGDLDVGLALFPPAPDGVAGEPVRAERVSAILGARHRLAAATVLPLADLRDETLLLFPRHLAPAYYDGIVAACHQAGFTPRLRAFDEPPVNAMLSRLASGREVGLAPASFTEHAAKAGTGVVHRDIVDPSITAEFSVLWPTTDPSPAITGVIATVRRHARLHGWLGDPQSSAGAAIR